MSEKKLHEEGCDCGCEDDEDDGVMYEVTCPSCGSSISLDEELVEEGEIECPNCGEKLEFELEDEEEEDGEGE